MSDSSILAMTGALFVSFGFLVFYSAAKNREQVHEIFTGVIAGVPISTRYRRHLLWFFFVPQQAAWVVGGTAFAAMFVVLARQAGAEDVGTLAQMCAAAAGAVAIFGLVLGIAAATFLASAVREAE
jgi:hypothetical protein